MLQSHDELARLLARAGVATESAELHGGLCGSICAGGTAAAEGWIADWMRRSSIDAERDEELLDALDGLRLRSWQALAGSEFTMQPLLPDDDADLSVRVGALADWCQGFLVGLALSGVDYESGSMSNAQVAEIVADFAEISKACVDETGGPPTAGDGFRFAELVEYVRAATQIVFEELAVARADNAAATMH